MRHVWVRVGVLTAAALGFGLAGGGCNTGIKGKLAQSAEGREREAAQAALDQVEHYVERLVDLLPAAGRDAAPDGSPAMVQWRRLVAQGELDQEADRLSARFEDTRARKTILDGLMLIRATRDYWLGRVISGLQERDELGEAGATAAHRVDVGLDEYHETLDELARRPEGHPWLGVIAFERDLPYFTAMFGYLAHGGEGLARNDIPFLAGLFAQPPRDKPLEEGYRAYRDRLCEGPLKGRCKVPYEYRDRVVAGAMVERLRRRLAGNTAALAVAGLGPVIARLQSDIGRAEKLSVVPPEYPRLPDTGSGWSQPPLTQLIVGPKGVRFVSKGARQDIQIDVLTAAAVGSWTAGTWTTVGKEVARLFGDVARSGASDMYTAELHLLWDGKTPLGLLRGIVAHAAQTTLTHLFLVGRRRGDGSLRRAANALAIAKGQPTVTVRHLAETWVCTPVGGMGRELIGLGRAAAVVSMAEGKVALGPWPQAGLAPASGDGDKPIGQGGAKVVPSPPLPAGPAPVIAPLDRAGSGLGPIRAGMARAHFVLLAARADEPVERLFWLLDHTALKIKPRPQLLVAVCDVAAPVTAPAGGAGSPRSGAHPKTGSVP